MLRALKTKVANFIRAQVTIVTEPRIEVVLAEQRILRAQIAESSTRCNAAAEQIVALSTLCSLLVEQTADLSTQHASLVEQTADLSRQCATVVTESSQLRLLVERNLRTTENERSNMDETQRMVGIACARIENFIKIQKEHSAAMEQSIASLLENRIRVSEIA